MNYIQKLEGKARANDAGSMELRRQLDRFRLHLCSPKFYGVDEDGSRRDWIAVSDVCEWLRLIESEVESAKERAEKG